MKTILSIQSHVAYGYVGNRAAVFPLQRMGYDVVAVHTVQFSNHTGYGSWTGDVFGETHIRQVLAGLKDRGVFETCDALLTGYAGSSAICDIICDTLDQLPVSTPWICDPVMGDTGRGFFVKDGIPDFFKNTALARATVLTPNLFEMEYLSGRTIRSTEDALSACHVIHDTGVKTILLTSLIAEDTPEKHISILASGKDQGQLIVTTPMLDLSPAPNGSGDCTAALFAGHLLAGQSLDSALTKTVGSIYGLFEKTQQAGTRELAMIAAQDDFVSPRHSFPVRRLS
ncbi:MAG TPA: pyridoxal kinase PdxY [Alphaproteobacteria bacterium]|jgi:pyridoxine kinase|nr:pyridoxal kinase PdxY [Alphaproteobacteria bacterium]MCB9984332.1 pyridoxal kinase PdxY [Micavibrio sp.]HRK97902.1 pyridoxal kinase PdxY [Alphaproteobacteria bacterium]